MSRIIEFTGEQINQLLNEKEEFTVFGRTLEQVEEEIKNALKNHKSFRVAAFDEFQL